MSYLLDTHVLWWAILEPEHLRSPAADLLARTDIDVHYSSLSLFELAVQRAKRRLAFDDGVLLRNIAEAGFRHLAVRQAHALRAGGLPPHHRDPFDRLLLAQAAEEGLTFISRDKAVRLYSVPVLEA